MSTARRAASAAAALTICAALTGCELIASTFPDSPTPTPVPTTTSKPTETDLERQMRLDYAAAEKAYRTSSIEGDRLIAKGASKPSAAFKAVATGEYLELIMGLSQQVRDEGYTGNGGTVIRRVVEDGYQEKKLQLLACEDVSEVKLYKDGERVNRNSSPYYVQHLTIVKDGSDWKVSKMKTTQLKSLEGQPCAST